MLALTHGAPKELLPVGGVPVVERVLRECAASGVREVLVVSAPGKEALDQFVLAQRGRAGLPARVEVVRQSEARGLADAIRLGRDFAASEPFAVVLPDNLFIGGTPAVAQVAATFGETGVSVVGVTELRSAESATHGPTAPYPGVRDVRDGTVFRIAHVPAKGAHAATFDTGGATSAMTGVGRYVFTSDVFDIINAVEGAIAPGAELDDIPVLQALHARGELLGRVLDGRFLDVGIPAGYREAVALLER